MTLDEAIKILEQERRDHPSLSTDVIGQAQSLGIEALKSIQISRTRPVPYNIAPLPGETEN